MSIQSTHERAAPSRNGFVFLGLGALVLVVAVALLVSRPGGATAVALVVAILIGLWCLLGLYMLQPNQAALLLLFGDYRGTDRSEGLRWPTCSMPRRRSRSAPTTSTAKS